MKEVTNKEELGKMLSEIKNKAGISYYKVLNDTNISVNAQKSLEKGTANYTIDSLFKFCKSIDAKIYIDTDTSIK